MDEQLKKALDQKFQNSLDDKFKGMETYPDTGREKPSAINDLRQGEYLKALGSLGEPLDSYLGVPYRETAYNLADVAGKDSSPMDYLSAIGRGLGTMGHDPNAAKTGDDVATKVFPDESNVAGRTALSTAINVSDLSSLIPGGVASKIGRGALMTGKVEDVSKIAQPARKSAAQLLQEYKKTGKVPVIDTEVRKLDVRPDIESKRFIKPEKVVTPEDVESIRDLIPAKRFEETRRRFGMGSNISSPERNTDELLKEIQSQEMLKRQGLK